MNQERQAQALTEYLDNLLQGEIQGPPVAPVDAEIAALGELGRSLAQVRFEPGSAHRAAIERVLKNNPPLSGAGGGGAPAMRGGLHLLWLLTRLAVLLGLLVAVIVGFQGTGSKRDLASPTPGPTATEHVAQPVLVSTSTRAWIPTTGPAVTYSPVATAVSTSILIPEETPYMAEKAGEPTPTDAVTWTPTPTVTPSATPTATGTLAPSAAATSAPAAMPTLTVAPVLAETGRLGLAFHPEHLNAGGVCQGVYSASGSLKNHGPGQVTGVEIEYRILDGAEWVDRVEIVPARWDELGEGKPGRFTVFMYTREDWSLSSKGTQVVVGLFVPNGPQSTFTVQSPCQAEPSRTKAPTRPDEPDGPGKPDKAEKTPKPKEQGK